MAVVMRPEDVEWWMQPDEYIEDVNNLAYKSEETKP